MSNYLKFENKPLVIIKYRMKFKVKPYKKLYFQSRNNSFIPIIFEFNTQIILIYYKIEPLTFFYITSHPHTFKKILIKQPAPPLNKI